MPVISHDRLEEICKDILRGFGASGDEAKAVAKIMVKANLRGHDSHGVIQLARYIKEVQEGIIKPRSRVRIVKETPSTALVDGGNNFGHYIGEKAMETAIKKAEGHGVGVVGAFNCAHVGMLAHYTMMALEHDMAGVMIVNAPAGAGVAPWGGISRVLGTNPLSIAVPAGREQPIVLDMATSVVAVGKVLLALDRGERVPEGWMIDSGGSPTTDPRDFFGGGAMLPFGGYKGYGLSVMVELLAGVLTGAGCSMDEDSVGYNGVLTMAIDIGAFTPIEEFKARTDKLVRRVKTVPLAPGFEEILLPGEKETREKEKRLREGIPIDEVTWKKVLELLD